MTLGLALIALIMVAIAENARIPVDNPATHLELTMVHEAMVLEYSGRHLALIELAGVAQAAALRLADRLRLPALGPRPPARGSSGPTRLGFAAYVGKLAVGGVLLALFETSIAKMRVFRVPDFLGAALMLGLLGVLLLFVSRGASAMTASQFDIAHLLAGGLVLISFLLLYQDRLTPCSTSIAAQAVTLSLSVAWQAYVQDAPQLYITAVIALVVQGDRHPRRPAPDHQAPGHPSRDRDR